MHDCLQQDELQLNACPPSLADWQRRLTFPSLSEIPIWILSQTPHEEDLSWLETLLSIDEIQRANRYRFLKDRNQFVTSRGFLRLLAAAYLEQNPRAIQFLYSQKGKPELLTVPAGLDLRFNVAHSGSVVLLAFAHGRRIGIDVEEVRNDFDTIEIAKRFFSSSEQAALASLPASQRHNSFFQCWTRKEAYIKATGDGLSLPLHQFDVTLTPHQPAQLIGTRPDPAEAEHWQMYDLDVAAGYPAALVVERSCAVNL